eukprot:CCRYP_006392-RA/>CCRYP_006392-RA protein AED:0.44 eAED:0.44 QI:173/1/0.5/1/0/0/2/0/47
MERTKTFMVQHNFFVNAAASEYGTNGDDTLGFGFEVYFINTSSRPFL